MSDPVHGLGRRPAPDPRDAAYPLRAQLPAAPSTRLYRYWNDAGWWGDQGQTPMCVGYAWAHWVEDGPVTHGGTPPIVAPAVIYAEAQRVDEWPGEDYDGTSVRAGAKALQARHRIASYHWAASVSDVVECLLEVGPVVVGTDWHQSMFDPDPEGFLHVSGPVVGGHAYVLNGVNREAGFVRLKNSWGRAWGRHGHAYLEIQDLAILLEADGEACLALEVRDA